MVIIILKLIKVNPPTIIYINSELTNQSTARGCVLLNNGAYIFLGTVWMHSPHTTLQGGLVYKTTVDGSEWLDSRRVNLVLCRMYSQHGIIL